MALPDKPITRHEMYLSNMAGQGTPLPEEPLTREEAYLDVIAKQGGGGGTGDGDMKKSVYDSDLAVLGAGGIKSFVAAQIAGKQDTISDLDTIRSGASAGATAVQPVQSATNGNLAGLDANGNLIDSGKKASDFLPSNTPIPSVENCYQSTDIAESNLANDDYFPFYDTSESGKRKSAWSNIKEKILTFILNRLGAGLFNNNGYIESRMSNFSVTDSGTASASTIKEQVISYYENSPSETVVHTEPIEGTQYMETTSYTTPSTGVRRFTFTSNAIQSTSVFDFYCDVFGVSPSAVTLDTTSSTHSLAVDFNASDNVGKCRVYIRG